MANEAVSGNGGFDCTAATSEMPAPEMNSFPPLTSEKSQNNTRASIAAG
jgi:hypothetical protein